MSASKNQKRNRLQIKPHKLGKPAGIIISILLIPFMVTSFIAEKSLKFARTLCSAFLDLINAPGKIKSMIKEPFDFLNNKVSNVTNFLKREVWFAPKATAEEAKKLVDSAEKYFKGKSGNKAFYDEHFKKIGFSENQNEVSYDEVSRMSDENSEASDELSKSIKSPTATNLASGRTVNGPDQCNGSNLI